MPWLTLELEYLKTRHIARVLAITINWYVDRSIERRVTLTTQGIDSNVDTQAVSSDSHRKGCDKRAHSSRRESRHSHSRSYRKDRRSPDKRASKDVYAHEWERVKDSLHSHGSRSHYRQSTSHEAKRLESCNGPNENQSSRFDQDLKGQSERRGRSISRTSSARSNWRPSSSALSSPHSHKRRRQRSRSRSVSRESKSRKHKRLPEESRRSVLTGKKVKLDMRPSLFWPHVRTQIKLKVKRSRGDEEREANRQELLQFLNSAYE